MNKLSMGIRAIARGLDPVSPILFASTVIRFAESPSLKYHWVFAVALATMSAGAGLLWLGVAEDARNVVLAGLVALILAQLIWVVLGVVALVLLLRLIIDLYSDVRHDIREQRRSQTPELRPELERKQ